MAPPYSLFSTKSFNNAFGTKVCLARSIADHDVLRKNVVPLFLIASLTWMIFIFLKAKTKQYLQGICPDGKMSSIGNFRRNFKTYDQTTKYIQITVYFFTFHRGIVFSLFQTFSSHPDANRMISNVIDFLYINIFHGILLPLKMEVPPSTEKKVKRPFYVRKPQILEPRREFIVNGISTLPKKSDSPQLSSCLANGAVGSEHRYKYLRAKGRRKRREGTRKDTDQDVRGELRAHHESGRRDKMKGEAKKELGNDNDQAVEGGMSDQESCKRRRNSSSTQKAFDSHSLSCDTSGSFCPIDD